MTLEALGQHENAKLKYQKALEYDPSLAEAGYNLDGSTENIEQPEKEIEGWNRSWHEVGDDPRRNNFV